MAKRLLTECPYCHRKVSFIGANILKTKGEHNCRGCKCISNVVIHRSLYGIAGASVIASLITLLLNLGYGDAADPMSIFYVALPFLIFYLVVPFFVKLEPCNDKSAVNKLHRRIDPVPMQPKKQVVKPEKPIELDVGDDFKASFIKAKSTAKPAEEDNEDKYNRIISEGQDEKDITSGLDIDISGSMNFSEQADAAQEMPAEEKNEIDENNENNEISFTFGEIKPDE